MKKFPKRLFTKTQRLSNEFHSTKWEFDKKITEVFGGHYSDIDDDWLIDCLDYGTGKISYEDFCQIMKKHKKENNWS